MFFHKISTIILGLLFYKVPKFDYTDDEIREYDRILNNVNSSESIIDCDSNIFPKYKFIQYISETRNVLLHGSNNKLIQKFEPRKSTLFNGKSTEAVFASNDGIWPVFYAVLDRKKLVYNFRNGSLSLKTKIRKFHFYSLDQLTTIKNPWTSGMVYFLPNETFEKTSDKVISFDEWISEVPVKPLFKIEVGPSDFFFLDKVATHHHKESIIRTWVMYKLRTKLKINSSKKAGKSNMFM